jgi:hypothetical protein
MNEAATGLAKGAVSKLNTMLLEYCRCGVEPGVPTAETRTRLGV